ncbi:hypothetical protein FJQ87_18570 (plasmid) [Shewanella sp. SNU WT4]|uniref:hypothetical protein n=1 Tax=Shewanella sp. SNU WT4 TaxID=2590015 RepID=UPI001126400B|nr:hypothetical protein [Shewanella sp. SNU WT4]QDF68709.1 hypothetical protein FJQ87_18570 [Shewanella sp. SNU WT4]
MSNEQKFSDYSRTIVRTDRKPHKKPQKPSAKSEQQAQTHKRAETLRERLDLAKALDIPIHELEDF